MHYFLCIVKKYSIKINPSRIFCAILLFLLMNTIAVEHLSAQIFTTNTLQHPKDQIALQLGAIQMGYTVPFTLTGNISASKRQQAANALVMGRNALDATAAKPALKVQGAVNCPNVNTVDYRDQLYSAVEHAVTSPVVATIRGSVTLEGGKKTIVSARLTAPPNEWTIPVPYALEARSSADVDDKLASLEAMIQELRDELAGNRTSSDFVTVQHGTFPEYASPHWSRFSGKYVATFQIGKYEVIWGEWKEVRDWAVNHGYTDLAGSSVQEVGGTYPSGSADNFPVINVNLFDVMKWCNAKSEKEGLSPVYLLSNGEVYRTGYDFGYGTSAGRVNRSAKGYRLPTDMEHEWASRGGVIGVNNKYKYSGSNDLNSVAWYQGNSSHGTKAVGTKLANELGIYDMIGNVSEWCEFASSPGFTSNRGAGFGGSWFDNNDPFFIGIYGSSEIERSNRIGFRLARKSGN